jgi:hypothetical protein
MRVWTTSPDEFKHVRTIMCAVYFGGPRARMELKSGNFAVGVIVSRFRHRPSRAANRAASEAAISVGRMFGELHLLPEPCSLWRDR